MTGSAQHFVPERIYTPKRPAIICGDRAFSYAELFGAVSQAVGHFDRLGARSGDRVGILSPNNPEYLITLLSLWRTGAVPCLLNTRNPENILSAQLRSVNCRFFLTPSGTSTIPDITHVLFNGIISTENGRNEADGNNLSYPLDQEATIIFTSGSTAQPKAVLHTLANHYYSALGSNEHIPVVPGDQWLLSLPLYHVGGLSILFRTFLGGGSIVIPEPQEDIGRALRRHDITHISLVPTQLIRLLRNKDSLSALKKLKVILLGGGQIPDSLIQNSIKAGLPVYTTYGLSEMASQVATSNRLTKENSSRSAKILNYRKLMISEENEIFVKGETLFKGYIKEAELSYPFNTNGYFATGDLGHFSDDGNLVVTGRKDNMFISGGENIQPEEIERFLCQMEGIEQAVVVPVIHSEFGFRPVTFIRTSRKISLEHAVGHLKKLLPRFKIPEQFYLWPDEKKEENPKVSRRYLAQLAEKNPASLVSIE